MATLDLVALGSSLGREVLSLDVMRGGAKVLVHTSGAELWELSPVGVPGDPEAEEGSDEAAGTPPGASVHEGGGPLLNGHFGASVTCLAASPSSAEFASGGSDGTVRVYDAATKSLARLARLGANDASATVAGVSALAYSADGAVLLAGVSGGVDVLDPSNLTERVARLPVGEDEAAYAVRAPAALLRFSPDGSLAAVLDDSLGVGVRFRRRFLVLVFRVLRVFEAFA